MNKREFFENPDSMSSAEIARLRKLANSPTLNQEMKDALKPGHKFRQSLDEEIKCYMERSTNQASRAFVYGLYKTILTKAGATQDMIQVKKLDKKLDMSDTSSLNKEELKMLETLADSKNLEPEVNAEIEKNLSILEAEIGAYLRRSRNKSGEGYVYSLYKRIVNKIDQTPKSASELKQVKQQAGNQQEAGKVEAKPQAGNARSDDSRQAEGEKQQESAEQNESQKQYDKLAQKWLEVSQKIQGIGHTKGTYKYFEALNKILGPVQDDFDQDKNTLQQLKAEGINDLKSIGVILNAIGGLKQDLEKRQEKQKKAREFIQLSMELKQNRGDISKIPALQNKEKVLTEIDTLINDKSLGEQMISFLQRSKTQIQQTYEKLAKQGEIKEKVENTYKELEQIYNKCKSILENPELTDEQRLSALNKELGPDRVEYLKRLFGYIGKHDQEITQQEEQKLGTWESLFREGLSTIQTLKAKIAEKKAEQQRQQEKINNIQDSDDLGVLLNSKLAQAENPDITRKQDAIQDMQTILENPKIQEIIINGDVNITQLSINIQQLIIKQQAKAKENPDLKAQIDALEQKMSKILAKLQALQPKQEAEKQKQAEQFKQKLEEKLAELVELMKDGVENAKEKIQNILNDIWNMFDGENNPEQVMKNEKIVENTSILDVDKIKERFDKVLEYVKEQFQDIGRSVEKIINDILVTLYSWDSKKQKVEKEKQGDDIENDILSKIRELLKVGAEKQQETLNEILVLLKKLEGKTDVLEAKPQIVQNIQNNITIIINIINPEPNSEIKDKLDEIIDLLKQLLEQKAQKVEKVEKPKDQSYRLYIMGKDGMYEGDYTAGKDGAKLDNVDRDLVDMDKVQYPPEVLEKIEILKKRQSQVELLIETGSMLYEYLQKEEQDESHEEVYNDHKDKLNKVLMTLRAKMFDPEYLVNLTDKEIQDEFIDKMFSNPKLLLGENKYAEVMKSYILDKNVHKGNGTFDEQDIVARRALIYEYFRVGDTQPGRYGDSSYQTGEAIRSRIMDDVMNNQELRKKDKELARCFDKVKKLVADGDNQLLVNLNDAVKSNDKDAVKSILETNGINYTGYGEHIDDLAEKIIDEFNDVLVSLGVTGKEKQSLNALEQGIYTRLDNQIYAEKAKIQKELANNNSLDEKQKALLKQSLENLNKIDIHGFAKKMANALELDMLANIVERRAVEAILTAKSDKVESVLEGSNKSKPANRLLAIYKDIEGIGTWDFSDETINTAITIGIEVAVQLALLPISFGIANLALRGAVWGGRALMATKIAGRVVSLGSKIGKMTRLSRVVESIATQAAKLPTWTRTGAKIAGETMIEGPVFHASYTMLNNVWQEQDIKHILDGLDDGKEWAKSIIMVGVLKGFGTYMNGIKQMDKASFSLFQKAMSKNLVNIPLETSALLGVDLGIELSFGEGLDYLTWEQFWKDAGKALLMVIGFRMFSRAAQKGKVKLEISKNKKGETVIKEIESKGGLRNEIDYWKQKLNNTESALKAKKITAGRKRALEIEAEQYRKKITELESKLGSKSGVEAAKELNPEIQKEIAVLEKNLARAESALRAKKTTAGRKAELKAEIERYKKQIAKLEAKAVGKTAKSPEGVKVEKEVVKELNPEIQKEIAVLEKNLARAESALRAKKITAGRKAELKAEIEGYKRQIEKLQGKKIEAGTHGESRLQLLEQLRQTHRDQIKRLEAELKNLKGKKAKEAKQTELEAVRNELKGTEAAIYELKKTKVFEAGKKIDSL